MARGSVLSFTGAGPSARLPLLPEELRLYTYDEFCESHLNPADVNSNAELELCLSDLRKLKPRRLGLDFEVRMPEPLEGESDEAVFARMIDDGELRTIQFSVHEPPRAIEPRQWLLDLHRVDARPLIELLADRTVEKQIQNLTFEQQWAIDYFGAPIERIYDPFRAWRSIRKYVRELEPAKRLELGFTDDFHDHNGKLSTLCELFLGFTLPKEVGASDWGAEVLTEEQRKYAVLDVAVLPPLCSRLRVMSKKLGVDGKIRAGIGHADREVREKAMMLAASER